MKRQILLLAALILFAAAAAEAPEYTGLPTLDLGVPQFFIDLGDESIVYLPLDDLGRVQGASALLGQTEIEPRHAIGGIKPTGWEQANYPLVPGVQLFSRCHLIAHALGGSEIPENIITGTQYLNLSGMMPIENCVSAYIALGGTVRYEVIPVYIGSELVCRGVIISAQSVEDDAIRIFAYCHNVQPGVAIDYATGQSRLAETAFTPDGPETRSMPDPADQTPEPTPGLPQVTYVLNTNTHRFHLPTCQSVTEMNQRNRRDFYGDREELIDMGYRPCGRCDP